LSSLREKVRLVLESLVTALLFGLQSIVYGGWAISVMAIPLLPYLMGLVYDYMQRKSPNLGGIFICCFSIGNSRSVE
jgi:ABC-type phosphate transport system permease subunit